MQKYMRKKGFVFTSIVIVVFLFLVVMNPSSNVDTSYKNIHKWQGLIENTNDLLEEIESYQMPLVIRGIGHCALNEMASNSKFAAGNKPYDDLNGLNDNFKQYLIGSKGNCKLNLSIFLDQLKDNLKIMNYNFTYSLDELYVNLSQNERFKMSVFLEFPYNISIVKNNQVFSIQRNISLYTTIPIIGLRDPMSTWATQGKHNLTIHVGPSEKIFDYEKEFGIELTESDKALLECYEQYKEDIANKTCLENLIEKNWYIYSPDAPSFLNRLLLNGSPSKCCGITTILNKTIVEDIRNDIRSSDERVNNWSYADYCQYQKDPTENCFFSNETCKKIAIENVTINGELQDVLIDLYNYYLLMNLTAFAVKDDESETIYYNEDGSCLSDVDAFISTS